MRPVTRGAHGFVCAIRFGNHDSIKHVVVIFDENITFDLYFAVTVQGSDPPSEQRGCSNLAAMAAYRFREVTQHVTLLPLAGLGDRE